jgi:hypothetical protein
VIGDLDEEVLVFSRDIISVKLVGCVTMNCVVGPHTQVDLYSFG